MTIDYPYVLLLLVLPYFIYKFLVVLPKSPVIVSHIITRYRNLINQRNHKFLHLALLYAVWVLVVVALAGVSKTEKFTSAVANDSLVIALDISYSMEEHDLNPPYSRLETLKTALKEFLATANAKVGLTVFGLDAYLRNPLTSPMLLDEVLTPINLGIADSDIDTGTSINDAILVSINALENQPSPKHILLLTDGLDTASRVGNELIAKLALEQNIRISIFVINNENLDLSELQKLSFETNGLFREIKTVADLQMAFTNFKLNALTVATDQSQDINFGKFLVFIAFLIFLVYLLL